MRVKRGVISKKKHNKVLDLTKGYRGSRSRLIRTAKAASLQAGQYAFHGRKLKKRTFRSLWITRISQAVKAEGISYSVFMNGMKTAQIDLDRKTLNDLLVNDPETFKFLVSSIKSTN